MRLLLTALLLLMAAHTSANARSVSADGSLVDLPKVVSSTMGSMHVTVWLPPGYARGRTRYGVVYMMDGENLFRAETSYANMVWAPDKAIVRLLAANAIDPVVIVGVHSPGRDRTRTFLPQRLYDSMFPPLKAHAGVALKGAIQSDAYLRFLTAELKPMIDKRFRTQRDRDHTTIMGSSLGGLIALYAIAEYPLVFGKAACLSTHWPLASPIMADPIRTALLDGWSQYLTDRLGPPDGRHIWFDHGDKTLDGFYGPWQTAIDSALIRVGWQPQRDFETRTYPGAGHDEASWGARLDEVFGWLLGPHDQG